MTDSTATITYRSILRRDGVLITFIAATIGRLSYAMISLALLLTIQGATHSYAAAGASIGGYAVISFLMPLKSRLIDRLGTKAVLPWLSLGFTLCVFAISVLAFENVGAALPYIALAVGAGLFAPPLGPSMRAIWAAVTPEPAARRRAYSLDGIVEEVLYSVGPLVVGGILLIAPSSLVAAITGAMNLIGTIFLVFSPTSRHNSMKSTTATTSTSSGWAGPFKRRGFVFLLLVLLGVGLGGGPLEVSLVARSEAVGQGPSVGYLFAALSIGSAIGGLLWGHFIREDRPRLHLAVLIAVSAAFGLMLVPTTNLIATASLLFCAGLASAPLLITAYVSSDGLVPEGEQREASTWVNTLNNIGVALGASTAGILIDRGGPALAFAAGAAMYMLTLIFVLIFGQLISPRPVEQIPVSRYGVGNEDIVDGKPLSDLGSE
ncbi:MFS transporter [Arthrobacter antibioticus]|uniref:MFS transporter n=1 Tax=Arthrobacter sp. H35-MC1 TaxID=3046203 RepID=UPI0024B9EC02|nr:MFS transporter [Arthrobacter sp. H35-MC1]MDJ0315808.1 MFS transporter [Arthrobacter sp. H35-MC1]